jgi:hypothetical protein
VNTSESFRLRPWSARCTLTRGRRICTAPTNLRPPAQYPATRRTFTNRQHDSRCHRYLRLWEQSKRSLTPDLSHLHPLPRHQALNIMHQSLQLHRPQIRARGHSSQTLTVPKDLPIRSRTRAVLTSVHPLLRCHRHHHLRRYGHHMSHNPTPHSSTAQGCLHCTPSRPSDHHLLQLLDQTRRILRTHQRLRRLTSLLLLHQLNL